MNDQFGFTTVMFASGQFTPFQQAGGAPTSSDPTLNEQSLFNIATPRTNETKMIYGVSEAQVLGRVQDILGGGVTMASVTTFPILSFDSYTDGLAALALDLKQFEPTCVLVPLKGGLKPQQVLQGMVNHTLPFEKFGFTNHTRRELAEQYESELRGILVQYAQKSPDLRLAVVDAGIGGDGSNHLAKILRKIHREIGGEWQVVFHILYVPRPEGHSFAAIPNKSDNGFTVGWKSYPVHHLLVEDWSPGIGIYGVRPEGKMLYKQSIQPGAVYAVDDKGHGCLAVGEDVCAAVNKLLSELGTKRLTETYDRRPEGDVYEENVQKFDRDPDR